MRSPEIEQGIVRLKGFLDDRPEERGEDIHELYSELLEMCAGDDDSLREVRQLDRPRGGRRPGWLACRWAGALAAVIALVSGSLMLIPKADDMATGAPVDPAGVAAQAAASQEGQITIEEFAEELEELAYLDELMSVPDTSLLADEDLAALLF